METETIDHCRDTSGDYPPGSSDQKCRNYFDTILAHTGQNYDYNLNGVFSMIWSWMIRMCI